MSKNTARSLIVMIVLLSLFTAPVLAGVDPRPESLSTSRHGGWLDEINVSVVPQVSDGILALQSDTLALYGTETNDALLFDIVQADPHLRYALSSGHKMDLTFNPSGPEFVDGRLNPFSRPALREAMNLLIDRTFISEAIYNELAFPMVTAFNHTEADCGRYSATISSLEAAYGYNYSLAQSIISSEMLLLGATVGPGGKWFYAGSPVVVIMIIRVEDQRLAMGDYVADQLESVGFTVDRLYKTRIESTAYWLSSDPADGTWHIYTGGWVSDNITRDSGTNLGYFYTPLGGPGIPLWMAYTPSPDLLDAATALWDRNFNSMNERDVYFIEGLESSMKDSVRVWLVTPLVFTPMRFNVQVATDIGAGVGGSALWPYTLRFDGMEGGVFDWGQAQVRVDPWNPIGGSNSSYDRDIYRATSDDAVLLSPLSGLNMPQRIQSATIDVRNDIAMTGSEDWNTLTFRTSIEVPADAWGGWDAVSQKFMTVGDLYPGGTTAAMRSVVVYPEDLFETVRWHDGSRLSVADFVMRIIMTFDPADPDSDIYDPEIEAWNQPFIDAFKGVRITSLDPLTIETYMDDWQLDAENSVITWWPTYGYGPGAWHVLAVSNFAEASGDIAYTSSKADSLGKPWTNYIGGTSLAILDSYLTDAIAVSLVPYESTLGDYISSADADQRYLNLATWYSDHGHFWVGTGPYLLDSLSSTSPNLVLAQNKEFVDLSDRWSLFAEPEINLKGNGLSILNGDLAPSTLDDTDFGIGGVGGIPVARIFRIENQGSADLRLTVPPGVSISGTNAADFSLAVAPDDLIAGGGFTTFQVSFSPGGVGLRSALITIENNDADEDPYTFAIQGTGMTLPGAFAKYYPSNGATNRTLTTTLSWLTSAGATSYEYCIDIVNNDECDTAWVNTGTTRSAAPTLLGNSTYYWQVRALNAGGATPANGGGWWSFSTIPCYSLTISNSPVSGGSTLSTPIPNCAGGLYLAGTVVTLTGLPDAGYGFYRWTGSISSSSNPTNLSMTSNRSVTANFVVVIPGPFNKYYPSDGAVNRSTATTLTWLASARATSYYYCIDTIDNDLCDTSWVFTGTTRSAALTGLTGSTTYFWQVLANNIYGGTYASGGWWSFTTNTCYRLITTSEPSAGGSIGITPATNCAGGLYSAGTSITLTANPAAYYTFTNWSGDASGSSNPLVIGMSRNKTIKANFLIDPPGAFSKYYPADGAVGRATNATLTWLASARAVSYEYCIDAVDDDLCNTSWVNTGTTRSAPQSGLAANTTYYWQVRAINANPAVTPADAGIWWSFTTGNCYTLTVPVVPAGVGSVEIDLPPNCAGNRYSAGTVLHLTPTVSAPSYVFSHWSGDASGGIFPLTVTMTRDKSITANFVIP